ncbi:MAG: hypothetical protein O3A63_04465 [Proteobacteria bacterium]|nr:hypothetical protein [Pseudomonadota bacterium]
MTFKSVWLCAVLLCATPVAHAGPSGPQVRSEGEGVIQALDFSASSITVSGLRYRVDAAATVSVQGSFGALTLLETGMKVKFVYWQKSDRERVVVELEQLPASTHMDES